MSNCRDCKHYYNKECRYIGRCTVSNEEGFWPKVDYWVIENV